MHHSTHYYRLLPCRIRSVAHHVCKVDMMATDRTAAVPDEVLLHIFATVPTAQRSSIQSFPLLTRKCTVIARAYDRPLSKLGGLYCRFTLTTGPSAPRRCAIEAQPLLVQDRAPTLRLQALEIAAGGAQRGMALRAALPAASSWRWRRSGGGRGKLCRPRGLVLRPPQLH